MMNKVLSELIKGKNDGETSMSITMSDLNSKNGIAPNLFTKFQDLQDKIEQRESMLKLAK